MSRALRPALAAQRLLLLLALGCLLPEAGRAARYSIDLEGGPVWSGYNDVRIPGEGGSRFSLSEDLSTDPGAFWRARLGTLIAERHHLSAFAAPLRLAADGRVGGPVRFAGTEFPAGSELAGTYRFDSYRISYRYRLRETARFTGWLGFTAKIRDAEIAVSGAGLRAAKTDTGFVPLLAFRAEWRFGERFGALLEGDALAGGPGRAEDVFLGLTHAVNPGLRLRGGYRLLEGGADVPAVYNFALLHFLSLGAELVF